MKKNNIKVGDRVRVVKEYPDDFKFPKICPTDGKIGTVKGIRKETRFPFGVLIDGDDSITTCHEVKLLNTEKQPVIVITSDGKTTTAVMRKGKKILKQAKAVCSDDDEFKYSVGATLAFARLVDAEIQISDSGTEKPEKPKLFTGKVLCVSSRFGKWWTPGKVYEVKDGVATDNVGSRMTGISGVKEMNEKLHGMFCFIPFVELELEDPAKPKFGANVRVVCKKTAGDMAKDRFTVGRPYTMRNRILDTYLVYASPADILPYFASKNEDGTFAVRWSDGSCAEFIALEEDKA